MNNATNVKETVTHNGPSNSRNSPSFRCGDVAAENPASCAVTNSQEAESVKIIWDDIQ